MADKTSNYISAAAIVIMLILTIITLSAKGSDELKPRVEKLEYQMGQNTTDIARGDERWRSIDENLKEIKADVKKLREKQ